MKRLNWIFPCFSFSSLILPIYFQQRMKLNFKNPRFNVVAQFCGPRIEEKILIGAFRPFFWEKSWKDKKRHGFELLEDCRCKVGFLRSFVRQKLGLKLFSTFFFWLCRNLNSIIRENRFQEKVWILHFYQFFLIFSKTFSYFSTVNLPSFLIEFGEFTDMFILNIVVVNKDFFQRDFNILTSERIFKNKLT